MRYLYRWLRANTHVERCLYARGIGSVRFQVGCCVMDGIRISRGIPTDASRKLRLVKLLAIVREMC